MLYFFMDDRLLMKGKAIVMFLHKWSMGGGGGGREEVNSPNVYLILDFMFLYIILDEIYMINIDPITFF